VLGLLLSVPNVTTQMIEQQLEIANHAKVVIGRLRADLDAYCRGANTPPLVIQGKRALGYWLDKDTKDRIRLILSRRVTPLEQLGEAA
jgi:hypothetical protein